jgi:hypothetical protein
MHKAPRGQHGPACAVSRFNTGLPKATAADKGLGADVFPHEGANHAQTQNSDGAMVLLKSGGNVTVLSVKICTPTESTKYAKRSQAS